MAGGFRSSGIEHNRSPLTTSIAVTLLLLQAALSWFFYMNHALVPDELFFLEDIQRIVTELRGLPVNPLRIKNALGYGALYWITHSFFLYFKDPQLAARFFYWLIFCINNISIFLIAYKWNRDRAVFSVILLLLLPMAWWQGKITGPEPLSHFFFIASLLCAVFIGNRNRKTMYAALLFGLAAGVKLTALPLFPFLCAVLYLATSEKPLSRSDIKVIFFLLPLGILFGFILANPFAITSPRSLLSPYVMPATDKTNTIATILFQGKGECWDAVPLGSLFYFGPPYLAVIAIFILSLINRCGRWLTIAWLLSVIAVAILSVKTPNFFGWYFYSAILVFPLLLATPRAETTTFGSLFLIPFIILIAGTANLGTILDMVDNKLAHQQQITRSQNIEKYNKTILTSFSPDIAIDFSDFNLTGDYVHAAEPNEGNIELIGFSETRKSSSYSWLWYFHIQQWIPHAADGQLVGCKKIEDKKKILIIAGDRLIRNREMWSASFNDWVQKEIVSACPGWKIAFYDYSLGTHYVLLENHRDDEFSILLSRDPFFTDSLEWGKPKEVWQGGVVVGPGADNPNVLSQRISIQPLELMKISAKAASAKSTPSTGRLQINWIDSANQFISSSGITFQATNQERSFETIVTAPMGAVVGYLYVAPHNPDDIIRFTEMRLSGTPHGNKEK